MDRLWRGAGKSGDLYRKHYEGHWWTEADTRTHVISKGIVRFHVVYWTAILMSEGEPLPTAIFVHDHLTVDEKGRQWSLAKAEKDGDPAASSALDQVLSVLVYAARVVADELTPFLPSSARRVAAQLGPPVRYSPSRCHSSRGSPPRKPRHSLHRSSASRMSHVAKNVEDQHFSYLRPRPHVEHRPSD